MHYSGVLLEENHYYPYGLLIEGITPDASVNGTINKYKFIDRELQLDYGLNQYDLGARFYDPAIGRFNVIDPFADFAANFTPYRYGFDNPVSISDPTGLLEDDFEREYGDLDLNGGNGPGEGITGVSIPINTETSKQKSEQREEVEMIRLSAFEGLLEENHNNYVIAQRNSTEQERKSDGFSDYESPWDELDAFEQNLNQNIGNVDEVEEISNELRSANDCFIYAGYVQGVFGLSQLGLINYRQSLSISSKIGTFRSFSIPYRVLGNTRKVLGGAGYLGAGLNTFLDYTSMLNGHISATRFGYRTASSIASLGGGIAIGATMGGPWGAVGGALISATSWAAEKSYDGFVYWQEQMSKFMTNFENGLNNGWVPGR